jgi:TalC/MipB family fructose-6-phosphate aldolase
MDIWLDTVNKKLIAKAQRLGILYGVTTNPTLIAQSKQSFEEILKELLSIQSGCVTAQVIARDTQGMLKQAEILHQISDRIIIKIPATEAGFEAICQLSKRNIPTMATAIFHPNQVLLASLAGAQYAAPYVSGIEKSGDDAYEQLTSMKHLLVEYNYKTKILAASIKNTEQIRRCLDIGIHAVTLKDDIFEEFTSDNRLTESRIELFEDDWKKAKASAIFK